MLSDLEYMNRALDLAERGRGRPVRIRWSARSSCAKTARSSGRDITSAPEDRTPRCARSTRPGSWRAGRRSTARSSRAATSGAPGPCVERVAAAGIARVVAATVDPDPRVSGRGFEFLRQKGIDVSVGAGRERALRLNRAYFTFKTKQRPFVIMKAATSLDNRVAARPGERTPISSDDSLRHAHAVRAEIDAIAVGSGTVLVDDPLLTVREVHRRRPLARVLFDRRLRMPPSAGCSRRSRRDR